MATIWILLAIPCGFAASIYLAVRLWRRYSHEGWLTKLTLAIAIPVVALPAVGMFASAFAFEPDALQDALGRVIAGLILTAPIVCLAVFADRRITRHRASR